MESAGSRLKKLRQEKGISLEEVHKKTNIHLDILKSIEEDSLVNLNPVYIKGFIKIYCQFLGVDSQEYLGGYRENGMASAAAKPAEKDDRHFWGVSAKKNFFKPQIVGIIVLIAALLILTLGAVKLVKLLSRPGSKKPRAQLVLPKPKAVKKAEKKPALKPKAVASKAATPSKTELVSQSASAGTASAVSEQAGVRIGLQALDDCWVQARLDGKIVFQNILKKGRFESWSAKDKIELSLGSAGGVRLEVNGKLIPSLGRKGQVLKNILITKDGLKVGK